MAKKRKARRQQGVRISNISIYMALASAAIFALLGIYFHFTQQQTQQQWRQEKKQLAFESMSASLQNTVNKLIARVNALSDDLSIMSLAEGDIDLNRRLRQAVTGESSIIADVYLVLQGREPDDATLGYAAKYLLNEAFKGNMPPLAYYKKGKKAYLATARRINNDYGVYIALHAGPLRKAFQRVGMKTPGRLELRQYADDGQHQVLWSKEGEQTGEPLNVELAGSRWRIFYWPLQDKDAFHASVMTLGSVAVAWLVLVVFVFLLTRRFNKSLRSDLVVLINLTRDLTTGRRGGHYPVKLAEFQGTVDVILRSEADRRQRELATAKKKPASKPGANLESMDLDKLLSQSESEQKDMKQMEQKVPPVTVSPSLFRTYDIRGVVGRELTATVARMIGSAIGSEALDMGQTAVIVARDGRLSGPEITKALVQGILETGCHVTDIGMVPTPVLYFATNTLDSQSGVMVTGSHNPPDYNGFKIVLGGNTLSGDQIKNLRLRIESKQLKQGKGQYQTVDVLKSYLEKIATDIRLSRPLKVVIDCGSGVAGAVAPLLYKALGCEVIPMYCEVDGNFPAHHPDPSQPENLEELIGTVKLNKAHLGLAFDGDGDRLGVVTDKGDIIWPDRQMMLFARDVLSRNPGAEIVFDVKCTKHLAPIIEQAGGVPVMWKTGHSLIKSRMKQTQAALAGEMSGHIFFKERWFGFDDALYAGARLLEIVANSESNVSAIFEALPNSINTPELRVDLREGEHYSFMSKLVSEASFADAKVVTIDGLRVEFPDGWGLIRASNTTPSLVLRFEADNESALTRIQAQFRELLLKVDPNLKLPF